MDFELWWLFLIVPAVFGLGWVASRIDLRQWRQEQLDAPRAYFKGLNFLLNEQQDKAIDAFIEAVQNDSNTSELHFALGNLFRRRGEYERAVRVHQHLLGRADLPTSERDRAQYALAMDYIKAGLLDRAEQAFHALENVPSYAIEARLALLSLHERAREWALAIDVATDLEKRDAGDFSARRSHYHCELASQAHAAGEQDRVKAELLLAKQASPTNPRPYIELARYFRRYDDVNHAFSSWTDLAKVSPHSLALVALDIVRMVDGLQENVKKLEGLAPENAKDSQDIQKQQDSCNVWREKAVNLLTAAYDNYPSLDILIALVRLEPDVVKRHDRLMAYLERNSSVLAASELLATIHHPEHEKENAVIRQTLERAAKPLDRYRCAACGFEATHYFWQCPGCLNWDSYPPLRIEEQ